MVDRGQCRLFQGSATAEAEAQPSLRPLKVRHAAGMQKNDAMQVEPSTYVLDPAVGCLIKAYCIVTIGSVVLGICPCRQ